MKTILVSAAVSKIRKQQVKNSVQELRDRFPARYGMNVEYTDAISQPLRADQRIVVFCTDQFLSCPKTAVQPAVKDMVTVGAGKQDVRIRWPMNADKLEMILLNLEDKEQTTNLAQQRIFFLEERMAGHRDSKPEDLVIRRKQLGLKLDGPYYTVVLVYPYLKEDKPEMLDQYFNRLKEGISRYISQQGYDVYVLSNSYRQVVLLFSFTDEKQYDGLEDLIGNLNERLMRRAEIYDIYAGIGSFVEGFERIDRSYKTAGEATEHKVNMSVHKVIHIRDVEKTHSVSVETYRTQMDRVIGSALDGNMELFHIRMQQLEQELSYTRADQETSRFVYTQMADELLKRTGLSEEENVRAPERNQGAAVWFSAFVNDLIPRIENSAGLSARRRVSMAEEYINEHYADPTLTANDIAEHVGVSASYLSLLFRQNRGIRLVDRINTTRIEHAKRLLETPVYNAGVVAQQVGYTSSGYFTRVFRRYAGMTPTEYKMRWLGTQAIDPADIKK